MRRVVSYFVTIVGTFYLAILFESRSLLLLGVVEILFFVLALCYQLFLFDKLTIAMEAPIEVTDVKSTVRLHLAIYNYSSLPVSKIRVCVEEEYQYYGKKRRTYFNLSADAKNAAKGETYRKTQVSLKLRTKYPGRERLSIRRVYLFDWVGIMALPLKKKRYAGEAKLSILPERYEVPMALGREVREYAFEREDSRAEYPLSAQNENSEIRGYKPGDKLHSIHWKLSAKTDDLMVYERKTKTGCPVLFFLDMAVQEKKKGIAGWIAKQKGGHKNLSELLTVIQSYSLSMVHNDCFHYVIWYDYAQKDIRRILVEDEEQVYEMIASLDGLLGKEDCEDIVEAYYAKYHVLTKKKQLVFNRKFQMQIGENMDIIYDANEVEKSLTGQEVIL